MGKGEKRTGPKEKFEQDGTLQLVFPFGFSLSVSSVKSVVKLFVFCLPVAVLRLCGLASLR
jgi:hypothetical protein